MKALKKKGVSPFLFPVSNQGLAHSFAEIFCWKKLLEKEIAFFFRYFVYVEWNNRRL
jgi:hypothetical protein